MLYTINTIQGKKYTIEENTNLVNLKHKILKEIGTPIDTQCLLLNGKLIKELPNKNSILYLVYKLTGG